MLCLHLSPTSSFHLPNSALRRKTAFWNQAFRTSLHFFNLPWDRNRHSQSAFSEATSLAVSLCKEACTLYHRPVPKLREYLLKTSKEKMMCLQSKQEAGDTQDSGKSSTRHLKRLSLEQVPATKFNKIYHSAFLQKAAMFFITG